MLQKSSYRKQEEDGWCGPAALQMLLLNENINLTQEQIADKTYDPTWGTPHENLYSFAKKYFSVVNVYTNISLEDLNQKIIDGMLVMVNMITDVNDSESGHYVSVQNIDLKKQLITIFDPDGIDGGILDLKTNVFLDQWYDYATEHDLKYKIKTKHWALVIDPTSKKSPLP